MVGTKDWTNRSVRLLDTGDPVSAVRSWARGKTLAAIADGWPGPPFDPFWLAGWLRIPLQPREDIRDAQLVVGDDGGPLIEFNPNRPKGRLRFSLAHEITHTFFPDW